MPLRTVSLPDGRAVEVLVEGPLDRPVVLALHGTPSTATFWGDWAASLDAAGLTLVAPTRAGYTGSTRRPGRRVVDAAADAVAVLDALGVERAATLGYSGGCPHALAVGAMAPDRCTRVVLVAGIVPYGAEGVDFLEGMGEENVEEFGAALDGEESLRRWMRDEGLPMLTASADDVATALGDLVDDSDRAVLNDGWAGHIAGEFHRVHDGGPDGWVDDDLAFVSPWGFDLATLRVPVTLWHAELDRMAPVGHSRWMADHVPGAELREVTGLGHLALLELRRADVVDSLVGPATP